MDDVTKPQGLNLEQINANEVAEFGRFKQRHLITHPTPLRPRPFDVKSLGVMFWFKLGTAIASLLLASMRTASMFYKAASYSGDSLIASAEAVTAVLAIEGGLVVYAASRAIHRKSVSQKWLSFAILMMVLISMVAGFGQSLSLITNVNPVALIYFQWALAIILGLCTSLVAYVGGEVLGEQIVLGTSGYEKRIKDYEQAVEEYNASLLAAWMTSAERKLIRGDISDAVRSANVRSFGDVRSVRQPSKRTREENLVHRPPVKTEQVRRYLDETWEKGHQVADVKDIVEHCDVAKSTASEIRSKWLEERGIEKASLVAPSNGKAH